MADVTVVIPAYNEAARIGRLVSAVHRDWQVLVVDGTADEASAAGATVVRTPRSTGSIATVKRGFREADGVVVTFDADGEHRSADIASLVEPARRDADDLVLDARSTIPRPSEQALNALARLPVSHTSTVGSHRSGPDEHPTPRETPSPIIRNPVVPCHTSRDGREASTRIGHRKDTGSHAWTAYRE